MTPNEVDLEGLGLTGALRKISAAFSDRSLENAVSEARMLLLGATGLARADLILDPDRMLPDESARMLQAWVRRRLAGEPATRILGERPFWTLTLRVTPDVLDPRPDSETLVHAALDALGARTKDPLRILDLGVGSGALLLALLSACPAATGVGIDLSSGACTVARENAVRNDLEARAQIRQGRWTEGLTDRFDLIVSNPPYIESEVIRSLSPEVRDHDPCLALDGGDDGLKAYREILPCLPGIMRPGAVVVLELGIGQAADVGDIARAAGLAPLRVAKDLGGGERALVLSAAQAP